jgi:hypothetical protein
MRQRYIIGEMNRAKYVKQQGNAESPTQILDRDYLPSQLYVQSTSVYRAIQSGYSELLGFYPPGEN